MLEDHLRQLTSQIDFKQSEVERLGLTMLEEQQENEAETVLATLPRRIAATQEKLDAMAADDAQRGPTSLRLIELRAELLKAEEQAEPIGKRRDEIAKLESEIADLAQEAIEAEKQFYDWRSFGV